MKLSNRELVSIIKAHRAESLGAEDGDLATRRADAMNHYHGRPYGNEVTGRSQIVSRDLAETVDWIIPALMRVFVQSGKLGQFDPIGPEDEQLAEQESDYTNRVMMQENEGFIVLHDAIKDTLLLKNGYTKQIWETDEKISEEAYTGLTMDQVQKLMGDLSADGAEVEIIGSDIQPGPMGEEVSLRLRITRKCGKALWLAVPAEEIRVSKKCRGSLRDSPFVEHVTRKTRSALLEMGLPRDFVDELPASDDEQRQGTQSYSRDSVDDESDSPTQSNGDRSMDEIDFCEAYVRVDADGDGIAELRKIVTCANQIPPGDEWNQVIEEVPIAGWVMKRVPHRHVGESMDDELADLQEIKTTLQRQLLDNAYFQNSSEIVVNTDAHLPDFMTRQPGGIKRTKSNAPVQSAVMPMQTPNIIPHLMPAIDYIDKVKEVRSGVRPGSDLDPDTLQNVTKGAFMENMNRASQKIEMIARMIGETGVRESFRQIHSLIVRHQDQARAVQLKGKWVQVNPAEWRERTDLSVRVGLGTGNEDDKRQKLQTAAQMQFQLLQSATQAPPQVYAKMYAMFEEVMESMGFDNPEQFAIAPDGPEYAQMMQMMQQRQQQPNPEILKLQQQGQLEQMRMTMQQKVDANRQEMEAQQQQAKMQMEERLAQFKAQLDMQLEERRMQIKAETDLMIARINAQAKIDVGQLSAAATLSPQQEAASDGAVDA